MVSDASPGSIRRFAARISVASISPLVNFSSRFIRTIIISRLLAPGEYGVVVALTTVYTIFEMAADVGLDRFVTVNVGPQRAQAVAAAQQIALIRGILLATIIAIFAPLLATLFGAGGHVASMRWLAFLPIIRSLANLRIKQVQQEYRNGPEAIAMVGSQLSALLAVLPALAWFHDERAMLVSLYVEDIIFVAISWIVVSRERVTRVDPAFRRAALVYGLPLLVNGVGIVVLSQLDRVIMANLFGLETLALYSLVVNLALVPLSPLSTLLGNLMLPFLVRSREGTTNSGESSLIVIWLILVLAGSYAIGVAIFLDILVPVIYGHHYVVSPGLHALVTILAFLRFSRQGPTAILLASGRTSPLAAANLLAGVGLALGVAFGVLWHRVDAVLGGIAIGDLLSTAYMLRLVRHEVPTKLMTGYALSVALPVGIAACLTLSDGGPGLAARGAALACGIVIIGLVFGLGFRRHVVRLIN